MRLRAMVRRCGSRRRPELHGLYRGHKAYDAVYYKLVQNPACRRCGAEYVFITVGIGAGMRRCLACHPLDLTTVT